jgi:chemotaxis protein CheX
MTHEQLTRLIRDAAHNVFDTMLGIPLVDRESSLQTIAPGSAAGVLALVGLAGRWAGSGAFSCTADSARAISSALLMEKCEAVNEDVLDAIGEVANMILGNFKTGLEEELGPMGLSIPTVIYGRNFTTRSVGNSQWTVVPFDCADEIVNVHVCLAPARDHGLRDAHARHHAPAALSLAE